MTTENNELNNAELEGQEAEGTKKEAEKMFSKEEVQEIIQQRLRQEASAAQKREAELRARLEASESKAMGSKSTIAEGAEGDADNFEQEKKVLEKYMPYVMEAQKQQERAQEFQQKLGEAIEKDPEFKTLVQTGNRIDGEMIQRMTHLDNAPAVLKKLLKDSKEHALMVAKYQEGPGKFVEYVNSLSNSLESSIKKPGPSDYQPLPDMTDGTEAGQDWDMDDYIKNKKV